MFRKQIIPYLMWLLPLSFFAYQFVLRVALGVFMPDIMQKFEIDALSFGVLSAVYYIGYAGMQIPIGVLLDKYNPIYVITGSIWLCALGTFLFATTSSWQVILVSRFLIGTGSAVGFLGTAKIIRLYFSKEKYSMMVGFSFTLGLLGAIYGGKPLTLLTSEYGWENLTIILAIVAALIGFLILLCAKAPEKELIAIEQKSITDMVMALLKNPKILFIGLCGGLMVGPLEGFADVWGIPYLITIHKFNKSEASFLISVIFIGMCFGGPLLSFIANKTRSYTGLTFACGVLMAALFVIMILSHRLEHKLLLGIFFSIGILCCYQVIVFTIVSDSVSAQMVGLATAITNSLNMAFGFLFHIAIGGVMDAMWDGRIEEGVRIYGKDSYSFALSIIPICALIGALGFLILKIFATSKNDNKVYSN